MSRYDYGFSDIIGSEGVTRVDGVIQRSKARVCLCVCVCLDSLNLYVPMSSV
jgi:hypothetical protein